MGKLKILVVDDESRMRKLVKDFLMKKDFDVLEAGDGEHKIFCDGDLYRTAIGKRLDGLHHALPIGSCLDQG